MTDEVSVETVLVPVDGSDAAVRAVEHASAVADRYDAAIHALYVLGSDQSREVRDEGADPRAVAGDCQAFLDSVREACEAEGVAATCSSAVGFSTGRLTQHPGSVILDCADDVEADFLVVPRQEVTDEPEVLAKAAEYVLSYASQPVLSV